MTALVSPVRPTRRAPCQDVTRECVWNAQTTDVTAASFDGGSSDPDGDSLDLGFDPPPPFELSTDTATTR